MFIGLHTNIYFWLFSGIGLKGHISLNQNSRVQTPPPPPHRSPTNLPHCLGMMLFKEYCIMHSLFLPAFIQRLILLEKVTYSIANSLNLTRIFRYLFLVIEVVALVISLLRDHLYQLTFFCLMLAPKRHCKALLALCNNSQGWMPREWSCYSKCGLGPV